MSITVTVDDVKELLDVMLKEVVAQAVVHGSNRVIDSGLDTVQSTVINGMEQHNSVEDDDVDLVIKVVAVVEVHLQVEVQLLVEVQILVGVVPVHIQYQAMSQ